MIELADAGLIFKNLVHYHDEILAALITNLWFLFVFGGSLLQRLLFWSIMVGSHSCWKGIEIWRALRNAQKFWHPSDFNFREGTNRLLPVDAVLMLCVGSRGFFLLQISQTSGHL